AARGGRTDAGALHTFDPDAVLRNADASLQRDCARTRPCDRIGGIHSRALPEPPAKVSGEEGLLMSVHAARKTEVDALIEHLLACADAESRKQYIKDNAGTNWIEVVAPLTERVWQEVRVDTLQAQRIADITIEAAEATAD